MEKPQKSPSQPTQNTDNQDDHVVLQIDSVQQTINITVGEPHGKVST